MTESFHDVVAVALGHAARSPDRVCVRTFSRRSTQEHRTFGQIADAAARAAAYYQRHGLRRGEVVVFLGTHHIDFYAAWLGCVWCGGVPTVLAEPSVRVAKDIYWARLADLLRRIDAWGVALDPRVKIAHANLITARIRDYAQIASDPGEPPKPLSPSQRDPLLLQHSSGTTGLQKGVVLSHAAVWRHAQSHHAMLDLRDDDVIASWLPLYHDMGLVACFLGPLFAGLPVVWLSPFEWVVSPALLFEAVATYRATLVWLPNFAFAFLAKRLGADQQFDLSSLRRVINCSEPISAEVIDAFRDRFTPDGLAPTAIHTCYAMAENVFAITASTTDSPPRRHRAQQEAWQQRHVALPADDCDEHVVVHVSSGRPIPDVEIRIVGRTGESLSEGHVGRVCVRSTFLLSGYFRDDHLNEGLLDAQGFFDTGDAGYLDAEGHLYVTGRVKDLIIVGGRNIYPQDVEDVVARVPGVYPGRVVCFGIPMRGTGTEGAIVIVESNVDASRWPDMTRLIRLAVAASLDLDLSDARVVPRETLRKSTSGKLARRANQEAFIEGTLGSPPLNLSGESEKV